MQAQAMQACTGSHTGHLNLTPEDKHFHLIIELLDTYPAVSHRVLHFMARGGEVVGIESILYISTGEVTLTPNTPSLCHFGGGRSDCMFAWEEGYTPLTEENCNTSFAMLP